MQSLEFRGDFETHITVHLPHELDSNLLRAWGANRTLKFLHILLDRGRCVSQPMLSRRGSGVLSAELAAAEDLSRQLRADGFEVARVKIEASPANDDIPLTDSAAQDLRPRYFEHHVKLLLEKTTDLAELAQLAERHSAHLSRNTMHVRTDGGEERFVTQRCSMVGRLAAHKALVELVFDLKQANYRMLGIEAEFVVYDSNLAVDDGWIRKKE